MNLDSIARLQDIFRAVFHVSPARDVTQIRQVSEPSWDSLGHVSLVVAIESEFNIDIDVADSLRITSYQAARLVLEDLGL